MKLNDKLTPLIKISFTMWLVCVFVFVNKIINAFISGNNETSNTSTITLLGSVFLGVASFGIGLIAITYKIRGKKIKKKSTILAIMKVFFLLVILPLFLLWNILQPIRFIVKIKSLGIRGYWKEFRGKVFAFKVVATSVAFFIILPVWATGYYSAFFIAKENTKKKFNLTERTINIVGTGSMYPTWPKGDGTDSKELVKQIVATSGMLPYPNGLVLFNKRILGYQLGRGDIVAVEDDKTRKSTEATSGRPAGLLKRVIAMEDDTIELREGIVYLNDKPLKEPYIAKSRSTFAETFLKECVKVTIPKNSIFVMGDNRKGSGDSRELGFFNISDVNKIIPLENQKGTLDKNWHDTTHDLDDSSMITLDLNRYVDLLNEKRNDAGLKPLKYQPKLEQSAKLRGDVMLKLNDFSYEAAKSG